MSLPFSTLEEFLKKRDGGELLSAFTLPAADYLKLCRVLAGTPLCRYIAVKRWFKEVGRLCGVKIKLKVSFSPQKPYMTEGGRLGLYYKDFFRPGYLFFAVAHETAHFLLMRGGGYRLLKEIDGQYPAENGDGPLRSPLEYCANAITLALFKRCGELEKNARKRRLTELCAGRLEEQI